MNETEETAEMDLMHLELLSSEKLYDLLSEVMSSFNFFPSNNFPSETETNKSRNL